MAECWRCSSEVECLSTEIGERDPEFTPQHKERKDGGGGVTNKQCQRAGV